MPKLLEIQIVSNLEEYLSFLIRAIDWYVRTVDIPQSGVSMEYIFYRSN